MPIVIEKMHRAALPTVQMSIWKFGNFFEDHSNISSNSVKYKLCILPCTLYYTLARTNLIKLNYIICIKVLVNWNKYTSNLPCECIWSIGIANLSLFYHFDLNLVFSSRYGIPFIKLELGRSIFFFLYLSFSLPL